MDPTIAYTVLGLLGVLILCKALREPYRLSLNEVELPVQDLPQELEGFSILHISDIHVAKAGRREGLLVTLANSELASKADLIAFTGDYAARAGKAAAEAVDLVGRILNGREALGVLGNNDYNPEIPLDEMIRGFGNAGLRILRNEGVRLNHKGIEVRLGGAEDPVWKLHRLRETFVGADKEGGRPAFRILLAHSPHPFDSKALLEELDIRVILAGHTHGGQICLPGGISLYPKNHHITRYVSGRFAWRGRAMFVTRGVGVNRLPLRLFCPPEINLVILRGIR